MVNKVTVFLPMRKGSVRVKNKNIRDFASIKGGLAFIKLSQLIQVKEIDKIIVSTDDNEIKILVKSFKNKKLVIDDRPAHLATSETLTNEIIDYIPSIIEEGLVIWTHVTSPFVDAKIYSQAIKSYFDNYSKHDSLMSVTKIQKFIWNQNGPITYDRKKEKWPRTQTIEPVYEINSGFFLADINIYKNNKDRIGYNPFFYELTHKESYDIDWEEDFEIAEVLWTNLYKGNK